MKKKVVLFDLDGTLLPMDQEIFVKTYFGSLAQRLAPHGYDPKKLIDTVLAGTKAMIKNDGSMTNEEVFWNKFTEVFGAEAKDDIVYFDAFYREDFDKVQASCGYNSQSAKLIEQLKEMGLKIAIATNPIFPAIATEKRIKWAGLDRGNFELVTTYENSRYCKPNVNYYIDIINELGVKPEECFMVGNDVTEDMIAKELGIDVFLLTKCLINNENKDISQYHNGNFDDLIKFIKNNLD